MHISVICPECTVKYQIKADLAGKKFGCKKCGAAIQIPAPAVAPSDNPSPTQPAADDADDFFSLPAVNTVNEDEEVIDAELADTLPPRAIKKKKKKKKKKRSTEEATDSQFFSEFKQGYLGGMPLAILASVLCGGILIVYCFSMIFIRGFLGNPMAAFFYTLRMFWLIWLTLGIYSGKALPRYVAILLTIFGIFWGYHEWAYLLPLDYRITNFTGDYLNLLLNYAAVILQCTCWTFNLIALLMPQSAEHCQEM